MLFRPTQDCYPPGSTYKTMTLMATLDSNTLGLNDQVFYGPNDANHPYPQHLQAIGPITVGVGVQISSTLGATGVKDISNIWAIPTISRSAWPMVIRIRITSSFAEAGVQTGVTTWLKYNHALYIDQKIPFDLPVKVSTVTPQPQANLCSYNPQTDTALTVPNLAEDSFGQGTDFVTPLQMMLINNVAADNGQLMRPAVIQKIVDPKNQTELYTFNQQSLGQPISATTAQGVRDAMYGVNQCGSGSLGLVKLSYGFTPWSVIGKTGTAQFAGETTNEGGDSWFITQAPYVYQSGQIPAITITAMKEAGGEGAYANGPMLNQDYGQIFTQVMKIPTPAPPPGGFNFCYQTGFLQHP